MSIEDSGPQVHGQFVRIQTYAREASKKAIQLAEAKAKATSKPVKRCGHRLMCSLKRCAIQVLAVMS